MSSSMLLVIRVGWDGLGMGRGRRGGEVMG